MATEDTLDHFRENYFHEPDSCRIEMYGNKDVCFFRKTNTPVFFEKHTSFLAYIWIRALVLYKKASSNFSGGELSCLPGKASCAQMRKSGPKVNRNIPTNTHYSKVYHLNHCIFQHLWIPGGLVWTPPPPRSNRNSRSELLRIRVTIAQIWEGDVM